MSLYEAQNYALLIYGNGIEQMPVDERITTFNQSVLL